MIPALERLRREKPLVSNQGTILLIGAAGQIGEHLKPLLEELYPGKVISVARTADPKRRIEALDITDTDKALKLIRDRHVEVVVNMAAFLSSRAQDHPEEAREVNVEAVKRLIEGSADLGVKQIFTPSTIAVYGPEDGGSQRHTTMESTTTPSGVYGKTKVELENFERAWNEKSKGAFATGMRLGGVLTCKMPPPSAGTAMEFDKIITAAAFQKMGRRCPELEAQGYYKGDAYCPKIPDDSAMPFILVDDCAREIVKYLHNVRRNDPNATRHHLASFTMDMQDLLSQLRDRTQGKFKCEFGKESENGARAQFIREWPTTVDVSAGKDWGFDPVQCADAKKAIYQCFDRVLESQKTQGMARAK